MLDIIIIILLLSGLFIGLKRGFIRQFIRLVTFIAAIAVAATYYGDLAPKARLDSVSRLYGRPGCAGVCKRKP